VLRVPNLHPMLCGYASDQDQRLDSLHGFPEVMLHGLRPGRRWDSSLESARVWARLPCSASFGILRWYCSASYVLLMPMDSDEILRELRRGGRSRSFGRRRCRTIKGAAEAEERSLRLHPWLKQVGAGDAEEAV